MLDIPVPLCIVSLLLIPAVGEMPEMTGRHRWIGSVSYNEARGSDKSILPDGRAQRSRRQTLQPADSESSNDQVVSVILVIWMLLSMAAIVIIILIGIHLCRLYERAMEASEIPYWKTENGGGEMVEKFTFGSESRKLAYSAQMYHYEQQKRRIIEEEKAASMSSALTDIATDEESNGENYVIYEYPGLASAEDLEIRNPLFDEDLLLELPNMRNHGKDEEESVRRTRNGRS